MKVFKVVLLALAVCAIGLVCVGALFFKMIDRAVYELENDDQTDEISAHVDKTLALNRPWVVDIPENRSPSLYIGTPERDLEWYKKNREEVIEKSKGTGNVHSGPLPKIIPIGTPFRITKLISDTNIGAGRTFYRLTIEFLGGDYSGKEFEISAGVLFEEVQGKYYGEPSKWPFKTSLLGEVVE